MANKEMKLLLYCTKSKPYLIGGYHKPYYLDKGGKHSVMDSRDDILNGKVVGECDFEIEEINNCPDWYKEDLIYSTNTLSFDKLLEKSCLDNQQLDNYLYGNNGYAIYIKNLHIYNEPRELNEYKKRNPERDSRWGWLYKAPQNMMYCFDVFQNHYVLISIHPEWLCKILNGEKTVEVRKKVLRGLLKNE